MPLFHRWLLHSGRAFSGACVLSTFAAFVTGPIQAAEIWDGPTIVFTRPANVSSLDPVYQDRITDNVWIARDLFKGIFNAASEGEYQSFVSPAGTEWADGQLADYASLTYQAWQLWNEGDPPGIMIGKEAVLHLIADDIYLSIKFLSWGGPTGGGAFSYERSTFAVPEPASATLLIATGAVIWVSAKRRSQGSAVRRYSETSR